MDTGAVAINMATKTKIMIVRVTKSTAMKAVGMMTVIIRLCMAGTRAIGETCRLDSQRRIDCRLAWNGNWNFGALCRPV
jgi:hypothetical protein